MNFRRFTDADANFCFKVRTSAYVKKFYNELGAEAVDAAISSYLPSDFIRLSKSMILFIIEESDERVGFISIKRLTNILAEIPLVYFDLNKLGMGYGSKSIYFIEKWVEQNWLDVKDILIDTIIPQYNGGFYEKMGYIKSGKSKCLFENVEVPAVRYLKTIKGKSDE